MNNKGIFITSTDTGVGKTVVTFVLGALFQKRGLDVGVMKPVQCAGQDAQFLKRALSLSDPLKLINPYFAPEPLSPHLAFQRACVKIDIDKIKKTFHELQSRHEIVLVEGAGGLLVPIREDYLVADLIRDLDLDIIVVSRLGIGTINHSLLTINQAQDLGLNVRGIIFNQVSRKKPGLPEKTNPDVIERLSGVPVLGTVPHLKKLTCAEVLKNCSSRIDTKPLLADCSTAQLANWKTRQLANSDKKYIWHPFTQMKDWLQGEPLVIGEAKGCYLKDTQGNWYLDGVSSLWVNVHGHRRREIDEAVRRQLNKVSHSTLLGLSNTPAVEFAKRLVEIAPKNLTKVFYSDNGSTAVEVAIKIAYQYWQNIGRTKKKGIIHFEHSYHGDTLGSVSVGGIEMFHHVYRHLIFKTIKAASPYCERILKGKERAGYANKRVEELERLLRKFHNSVAALVLEPGIQAAAGMFVWPDGILKKIEKLCRRYEVLLIADEVATGFGRTGTMFACEQENVMPDLMCLAKGITAGYLPLAATLASQEIYNGFLFPYRDQKTFFHGHTYTGNPLACAAALANLEIFEKEKTLARLAPKIKYLSQALKKFYNLPHVGDIRQKGFMVGIELVKNKSRMTPYPWEQRIGVKVCQEVRNHGVILRPLGNVIVLMPPLAISLTETDKLLEATYRAIEKITNDNRNL